MTTSSGSSAKPPSGKGDPVSKVYSRWQSEWSDCRGTITRFDGYLDALRKQGFGFVSALLTATGLIAYVSGTVVTPWTRFAILAVTQGLIVALVFLEKNYRLVQSAASARARILEARLNLAESDTIAYYYAREDLWGTDLWLGIGFVVLTALLGLAILTPSTAAPWTMWLPVLTMGASTVLATYFVHRASTVTRRGGVDFGVDLLSARQGTFVTFTVTSLYTPVEKTVDPPPSASGQARGPAGRVPRSSSVGAVPLSFQLHHTITPIVGGPAPALAGQHLAPPDPPVTPKEFDALNAALANLELEEFDSFTWAWDTGNAQPGVYRWVLTWNVPYDDATNTKGEYCMNWVDVEILPGPPTPESEHTSEGSHAGRNPPAAT